ncbi:MAG: polysaccharide biosynthesis tyrosine autokinase [Chloroflexi bacterium]|nr:polysaccharide biosynthesis tyrosine autokinase [Chloroflexota bacterium]
MENQSLDLSRLWDVLRRWWWLLLACMIVAAVSSFLGTTQMPRIYQATSTVIVGQTLEQTSPTSQDIYISQQLAETYREMIKRNPILSAAAQTLGLSYMPSAENVSARTVEGTQLLEISVRDTDPERARLLADEIAQQLILQSPGSDPAQDERRAFISQQLEELEVRIEETRSEIEDIQLRLEQANSARLIQEYQTNIQAQQAKLSGYQNTYASLLESVVGGTNKITMFEPARAPAAPISPNVPQTVMTAALIGLALAFAGAFLIEFLDDTVRNADEVTRLTGLPLMASIARMEGDAPQSERLITVQDPLSPISEAYRVLRTGVRFATVDKRLCSLMVTSSGPSEGKSVTVANLAVVFAESGQRVLLVDSDLRRPVQHRVFGVSNFRGLSDAILGGVSSLNDSIQATDIPNLWVMTAGDVPPNPSELLASDRMGAVIEALKERYDLVLFDSPPALVVADSSILGSRVDGVLLVTDVGQTHRKAAEHVANELRRARANLLGVVLNRVSGGGAGYGYGYGYGYYYRYEYRQDEDGNPVRAPGRGNHKRRSGSGSHRASTTSRPRFTPRLEDLDIEGAAAPSGEGGASARVP